MFDWISRKVKAGVAVVGTALMLGTMEAQAQTALVSLPAADVSQIRTDMGTAIAALLGVLIIIFAGRKVFSLVRG